MNPWNQRPKLQFSIATPVPSWVTCEGPAARITSRKILKPYLRSIRKSGATHERCLPFRQEEMALYLPSSPQTCSSRISVEAKVFTLSTRYAGWLALPEHARHSLSSGPSNVPFFLPPGFSLHRPPWGQLPRLLPALLKCHSIRTALRKTSFP